MLDTLDSEDLACKARELLAIKYASEHTRALRNKLVSGCGRKVVELELAPLDPLVIELLADTFTVSTGAASHADLRVTIPMRDLTGLLRRRIPLRALLGRRIGFRGSLRDAALLGRLLYVEVGDPKTAYGFFRHYFLDD